MSAVVDLTPHVGTRCTVRASFTDDDNDALADPITVVCQVRKPAGSTTTYTFGIGGDIVKVGVGVYKIQFILDTAGTWWVHWHGSGATGVNVVEEIAIRVEGNAVT